MIKVSKQKQTRNDVMNIQIHWENVKMPFRKSFISKAFNVMLCLFLSLTLSIFSFNTQAFAYAKELLNSNQTSSSSNTIDFSNDENVKEMKKLRLQTLNLGNLYFSSYPNKSVVAYDPFSSVTYGTHEYWTLVNGEHSHLNSEWKGGTLTEGTYYITQDFTFDCTGQKGVSPLIIQGNVKLIFENGAKLTCKGGGDNGQWGYFKYNVGEPGITLKKGSNLYVEGNGTIEAVGGKGSSAKGGSIGIDGTLGGNGSDIDGGAYGGTGGRGGTGGYGSAAGIGTSGADGGKASDPMNIGTDSFYIGASFLGLDDDSKRHWIDIKNNGKNHSSLASFAGLGADDSLMSGANYMKRWNGGDATKVSDASGSVYQRGNVRIIATGGDPSTEANAGNGGSYSNKGIKNGEKNHWAWGGGGGGAGGTGGAGAAIGTGGTGGGGGGCGASGSKIWTTDYGKNETGSDRPWFAAGGGGGGAGRGNAHGGGASGAAPTDIDNENKVTAGNIVDLTGAHFSSEGTSTGRYYLAGTGGKTNKGTDQNEENKALSKLIGGEGGKLNVSGKSGRGAKGGSGGNAVQASTDAGACVFTATPTLSSKADTDTYLVDGTNSSYKYLYPINECKVELKEQSSADFGSDTDDAFKFTGKQVKPKIVVTHVPTGTVVPERAYTVDYEDNIVPGVATFYIRSVGDATYSISDSNNTLFDKDEVCFTGSFNIKRDINDFELVHINYLESEIEGITSSTADNPAYEYTGTSVKPDYVLRLKDNTSAEISTTLEGVAYTRNLENNVQLCYNGAKDSISPIQDGWWFSDSIGKTLKGNNFSIVSTAMIVTEGWTEENEDILYDIAIGTSYEMQLQVANFNVSPYDSLAWAIKSGSLPEGLSLDRKTGKISGTPVSGYDATATIVVYTLAGESPTITLKWGFGDVQGSAKWVSGEPATGVNVTVVDPGTGDILGEAVTNSKGTYSILNINLKPRTVQVKFETDQDLSGRPQKVIDSDQLQTILLPASGSTTVNAKIQQATKVDFVTDAHATFSDGSHTYSIYGYSGDILTPPTPTNVDKGWKLEKWTNSLGSQPPETFSSEDDTFQSTYYQSTYTVHFDVDGGTKTGGGTYNDWKGYFDAGAATSSNPILPSMEPKKSGYVFGGWTVLGNESRVASSTSTYSYLVYNNESVEEVTLKAKWTKRDDIEVTLDANGSTSAPATINGTTKKVFANQTTDAPIFYEAPIREGYTFKGWSQKNTSSDATGAYTPDMSLTVPNLPENQNKVTYYAIWKANDIAVEFNTMGGISASTDLEFNKVPGEAYTIPSEPKKEGYTFLGWFTSPDKNSDDYVATNLGTTPTESVTYYAQWEALTSRAILVANDSTPDYQEYEGEFEKQVSYMLPEKEDATFVGWKVKGSEDSTAEFFITYKATDTEYEAVFNEIGIRVAFDVNGGSFTDDNEKGIREGKIGDTFTPPSDPTRSGYNFSGWATKLDGSEFAPTDNKIPSKNVTYYAYWKKKTDIQVTLKSPDASNVTEQTKEGTYEEKVDYTVPTRSGYAFVGWKPASASDETALRNINYPAENSTYEAVWQKGVNAVSFDVEGGKWTDDNENGIRWGKTDEEYDPPQDPEREGYEFKGWFTDVYGVDGAKKVTSFIFSATVDTVYYAGWEAKDITVVLDAGEGANPQTQTKVGKAQTSLEDWEVPSKRSYEFKGWKTTESDASATMSPSFPTMDTIYEALWEKVGVNVTLQANGGEFDGSKSELEIEGLQDDDYSDQILIPTKSGYVFDGWWTLPVGGTKITNSTGLGIFGDEDVIYYAHWRVNEVTVTLDPGSESTTGIQSSTGKTGDLITDYSTPVREGYAFVGWKLADSQDSTAVPYPAYPSESERFVAVWDGSLSVVLFNPNGGKFEQSNETAMRKGSVGTGFTTPMNPTRSGYTFEGWFNSRVAGNQIDFDGSQTFTSTKNVTYYAHWSIKETTVTLMMNDGTGSISEELTGTAGAVVNYKLPTREGFAFMGWSEQNDSTEGTFSITYPDDINTPSPQTLYAIWSSCNKSITYLANGGKWLSSENGIRVGKIGDSISIPEGPTKEGYTFDGWYTEPDGGTVATIHTKIPEKSKVYYAHWKVAEYDVVLDANGGTISGESSKKYTGQYGKTVNYETPVKKGYTFVGWNHNGNSSASSERSLYFTNTNTTYKAVWTPNVTSITYNACGGSLIEGTKNINTEIKNYSGIVNEDVVFDEPKAEKKAYEFDGWYNQPQGGNKFTTPEVYPTENTEVYAHWSPGKIRLNLDLTGGNIDGDTNTLTLQGIYGEAVNYTAPTKAGFVFKGFKFSKNDDDSAAKLNFKYTDTQDLTYYAVWADAEDITVNFDTNGGSYDDTAIKTTFTGKWKKSFIAPSAPSKENYKFVGWSTDPSSSIKEADPSESLAYPEHSTTYYAIWEAKTGVITLDANEGMFSSGAIKKECVGELGSSVNYEVPTRDGYYFAGWKNENQVIQHTIIMSEDNNSKTFTAVWAQAATNIVFVLPGVEGVDLSSYVVPISEGKFTIPNDPTRVGYRFDGWYEDPESDLCKLDVTAGESKKFLSTTKTVYYAHWTERTTKLNLDENWTGGKTTQVSGIEGSKVSYSTPTRPAYVFEGWAKNKKATSGDINLLMPTCPEDESEVTYYATWSKKKIKLSFDASGGKFSDDSTVKEVNGCAGDDMTLPDVPQKEDYSFLGWYTKTNGEGEKLGDSPTIPLDGDTTYYAAWEKKTATITFDTNGGIWWERDDEDTSIQVTDSSSVIDDSKQPVNMKAEYGAYVSYNVPTKAGYSFLGWTMDKADDSLQSYYSIEANSVTDGKTFYAKWLPSKASVAFVANGADNAADVNVVREGRYNEEFVVPNDPVKEGYKFVGWFNSPTAGTKLNKVAGDSMTYSVDNPTVYYARFVKTDITVELSANGGKFEYEGEVTSKTYPRSNETYSADKTEVKIVGETEDNVGYLTPKRKGYTFLGWNKSGNANDIQDVPQISLTIPSADVSYKACWRADDASVTFIALNARVYENGVSTGQTSKTYSGKTDQAVTYGDVTGERTGYIFKGWSTLPGGRIYADLPEEFPAGNTVFYANLVAKDIRITLNANGGTIEGFESKDLEGKYDASVSYTTPVRDGYSFVGWATSADATSEDSMTDLVYGYGLAVENETLYAVWVAGNVVVKYDANGGNFDNGLTGITMTGTAKQTYKIPNSPKRKGYNFAGWTTLPNGKGTDMTNNDVFPDNKLSVYYAKWEKQKYKVKLDANGGKFDDGKTEVELEGEFESSVDYSIPNKTGCAFMGWDETGDGTSGSFSLSFNETTKDKIYKAIWLPADASVTFVASDADDASYSKTFVGNVGDHFNMPEDPVKSGYVFEGWYDKKNNGKKLNKEADEEVTFGDSNLATTYYARFKLDATVIKLHSNYGDDEVREISGAQNTIVEYEELSRVGYAFRGWATKPDATTVDIGMCPTYPAKADEGETIDWYAVWAKNEIVLTFVAQGGVFPNGNQVITINSSTDDMFDLPNDPTKEMKTFKGWYTRPDGQGQRLDDSSATPSVNTIYYAAWEGEKIVVTLDPNGGTINDSGDGTPYLQAWQSKTKTTSGQLVVSGEPGDLVKYTLPVRDGYTFMGWNKSGNESDAIMATITVPNEVTTYYAVWHANDINITYVASDGNISGTTRQEIVYSGHTDEALNYSIPSANKNGYMFVGWTKEAGSSNIATEPVKYPTASETYYATFRVNQVTVNFDANGGTIGNQSAKSYTDQYGYSVNYEKPERDGYYFTGWSKDQNAAGDADGLLMSFNYGMNEATNGSTFYAQWGQISEDFSEELLNAKAELANAQDMISDQKNQMASLQSDIDNLDAENNQNWFSKLWNHTPMWMKVLDIFFLFVAITFACIAYRYRKKLKTKKDEFEKIQKEAQKMNNRA